MSPLSLDRFMVIEYPDLYIYSSFRSNFFQMATKPLTKYARPHMFAQPKTLISLPRLLSQSPCICRCHRLRLFSSSTRLYRQQTNYKDSFGTRLRKALGETKIKWYPIPAAVGIGFLGLGQFYRVNEREKARRAEEWDDDGSVKSTGSGSDSEGGESRGRPRRRERIRPTGPWFVAMNLWLVNC
jgi:phosphatidylserine decarboxylase